MRPGRERKRPWLIACLIACLQLLAPTTAAADDGHRLWLRYDPLPRPPLGDYRRRVTSVVVVGRSATLGAARRASPEGAKATELFEVA